jgi:putative hydrolase of HD superfamily
MANLRMIDFLAFIREANSLEQIRRGGFVISGISDGESVQAHSHGVALTALGLAELDARPVDRARLLLMALLHDIAESRTGDIVLRYQHYFPAGALAAAEAVAGREILAALPAGWRAAHEESLALSSYESRLVHAADKLQMMLKICAYEDQGRGDLEKFWKNPANFRDCGIASARKAYAALAKARGRKIPRDKKPGKTRAAALRRGRAG